MRDEGLSRYLVTATLARSATESTGPALLVSAIAVLGSASTGSYLVACLTVSAAVAGPVLGALVDRANDPRRAFASAMLVMAAGLTALALLLAHLPFWALALIALVTGIGYPAITGAWSAQLPSFVPESHLTMAYSRDAATYSIAAVVAPPIATALVGLAVTAPLWLPVILLAISVAALRWVPFPHRAGHGSHHAAEVEHEVVDASASLLADLKAGLGVMARVPALRQTIVITTLGFAGTAAVFVAIPLLSKELTGSLSFTAVLLGAFAVGGLVSALTVARFPVHRPDRTLVLFTALSGAALALVGIMPTAWLAAAAAFAMGVTEPPIVSGMFQVRAREALGKVRAQVFTTAASLRMTAFALVTAVCGLLSTVSIEAVIGFGVLLHIAALTAGIALGPRGRRWRQA